jgi:hypothetical protein
MQVRLGDSIKNVSRFGNGNCLPGGRQKVGCRVPQPCLAFPIRCEWDDVADLVLDGYWSDE